MFFTCLKTKTIESDMLTGLRLDGHNDYDHWRRMLKNLLLENGSINFISYEVKPLTDDERDNLDKVRSNSDGVKKYRSARFLTKSCMTDDLVHFYEDLLTAKAM